MGVIHKRHENTHDIAEHGSKLAGCKISCYDELGAEPGKSNDTSIDDQHHDGIVPCQVAFRFDKEAVEFLHRFSELAVFVIFPDICLYNSNCG